MVTFTDKRLISNEASGYPSYIHLFTDRFA